MKRLFPILLALAFALPSFAATRITATLTVTNAATNTASAQWGLLVNGTFRVFTNAQSSSSILTNTTIGGTATNVYSNTFLYPFTGLIVTMPATNQIQFQAPIGSALVIQATNWGTNTYVTNTITFASAIRVPMSVEASTNRYNFASQLVSDLSLYSTNAWASNAYALTNYFANRYEVTNILNVTVGGKLDATNGTAHALIATNAARVNVTNLWATNAYASNLVASNFVATNAYASNVYAHVHFLQGTNILTNKISVTFGLNTNTATAAQIAHVLSNLFDALQSHKLIVIP